MRYVPSIKGSYGGCSFCPGIFILTESRGNIFFSKFRMSLPLYTEEKKWLLNISKKSSTVSVSTKKILGTELHDRVFV